MFDDFDHYDEMEYDLGFEQSDLWADGVEYIYDDFGTFMGAVREVSFGAFGTINGDEHYYFWDAYRDTWGQLHIYDDFDNQPWAKKVLENWNPWAQSWEIEKVFDAQGRLMEKTTYDFYGLDSESIIWRDFYSESGVWTARSGIYENQNGYRIDFTGGTITSLKLYDRNGDEDWSRREYENLAGNTWEQQSVFNDNDVKISQEFNDIYGRDAGHQKYTDYWNTAGQYTGRSGVYQDGKNFIYEMDLSRNSYSRIEISDNPNIETWSKVVYYNYNPNYVGPDKWETTQTYGENAKIVNDTFRDVFGNNEIFASRTTWFDAQGWKITESANLDNGNTYVLTFGPGSNVMQS